MSREPLNSKRIQVINDQTEDIHDDVASLNESLVDKEPVESINFIEAIRTKLNILKYQIVHGDII